MKRVAVLGAGGMGTALALLFERAGAKVHLWTRDADRATAMAHSRLNARHLPGIAIPQVDLRSLPTPATRAKPPT